METCLLVMPKAQLRAYTYIMGKEGRDIQINNATKSQTFACTALLQTYIEDKRKDYLEYT